ncbi:MAG TPA: hypothetical protein VGM78_05515 [Ilumatobacteraceae bacterium]
MPSDAELQALVARVEQLERDNIELRARLAAAPPVPVPVVVATAQPASAWSRRNLIGGAAAAAAGVVAGVLIAAEPSAAGPTPTYVAAGDETITVEETTITSQQNSGDALHVSTDGDRAIVGIAAPDNQFGEGVTGIAGQGAGVHGDGAGWVGVRGTGYYGVMAEGTTYDLTFNGVHTAAPNSSTQSAWGDMYAQSANGQATLWFCVQQSAQHPTSRWLRLASPDSVGALTVLASPVRVYDSRPGTAPLSVGPKAKLSGNVDRVVDCTANGSGVPADATAVIINLTAVNPTLPGYMSTRANGTTFAVTSNLNWDHADQTVANSCTVACGAGATIIVRVGAPNELQADCVVDLIGYYR